jgi:membrane fusion protein (multidrug efflux system)
VELLKALIDKTEIRAPFSGLVGLRQISNGEFVNSSTLIATLQQIDPMKIEFAVPEKYASQLKKDESVSFTVEGNDSTFTAQLYAIDNSINQNTRSIIVRGRTANSRLDLKAGAFAKVQLNLQEAADALMIPADVLIPGLTGQKVYVLQNGMAFSRVVETGIRNENDIQIVSGINAGDTIVTSGLLIMKDSLPVAAVK